MEFPREMLLPLPFAFKTKKLLNTVSRARVSKKEVEVSIEAIKRPNLVYGKSGSLS